MEELNRISGTIIGAAIRIHTQLGPALKESVYERILARDLRRGGLNVERQKKISFGFEGMWFNHAARPDLIVENCVVVEIKAAARGFPPESSRQLLTYLRILDLRLGLILNFGMPRLKDGIKRIVNRYPDSP